MATVICTNCGGEPLTTRSCDKPASMCCGGCSDNVDCLTCYGSGEVEIDIMPLMPHELEEQDFTRLSQDEIDAYRDSCVDWTEEELEIINKIKVK
jgi:hypothetical protein